MQSIEPMLIEVILTARPRFLGAAVIFLELKERFRDDNTTFVTAVAYFLLLAVRSPNTGTVKVTADILKRKLAVKSRPAKVCRAI